MVKKIIKKAARYAGFEITRLNSGDFRWSHTVEDYYPISPFGPPKGSCVNFEAADHSLSRSVLPQGVGG
jgi:hypothetical protein